MYNQIIYFIVALVLFTLQQPHKQASATLPELFGSIAVFLLFSLYCRMVFRRIARSVSETSRSSGIIRFYRAQARLSILALGCLALYVYALDIKVFLRIIPGFDTFSTIPGLAGLAIYLLHLSVLWYFSHPLYRDIHNAAISRAGFLKGNLSFSSVILIPWLLVSLISDLLQYFKAPAFLGSDDGQLVLMVLAMGCFMLFAPWLVVRLWGCTAMPPGFVRFELRNFCDEHRFKVGDFLMWPLFGGEMLTAGVIGILPGIRYILITQGLLRILDIDELKAVVAHEMGHVRRLHLVVFFFFFGLFLVLVSKLSDLFILLLVEYHSLLQWDLLSRASQATLFSIANVVPMVLLLVLYFRFIFGFFLRNSERQADLFAMQLIGTPLPLITSFQKIASHSGRIEDLPNWHHYSIRERIQFLTAAYHDRTLVRRHDRKLYGSALLFVLLTLGLIAASAGAGQSQFARQLRENAQRMENARFQTAHGGALIERGDYEEAETALRSALSLDPHNALAMNNLAWLYATAPPPHQNPGEALKLAKEAADITPHPVILDTLAEAYYANGMFTEALETINRALSSADEEQRAHYIKQKEKFQQALRDART